MPSGVPRGQDNMHSMLHDLVMLAFSLPAMPKFEAAVGSPGRGESGRKGSLQARPATIVPFASAPPYTNHENTQQLSARKDGYQTVCPARRMRAHQRKPRFQAPCTVLLQIGLSHTAAASAACLISPVKTKSM